MMYTTAQTVDRRRTDWLKDEQSIYNKENHLVKPVLDGKGSPLGKLSECKQSQKRYMVSGSPCPLISFLDVTIQSVL